MSLFYTRVNVLFLPREKAGPVIDPFHVRENVSGGQNKGNLVLWELNITSCYCFVLQFDFIYINVKWVYSQEEHKNEE